MDFHQAPHTYVSHVTLKVLDLERAKSFYTEILGFQILTASPQQIEFTADGQRCLLTIIQPTDVQPKLPRRTGMYHFALLLPRRSDLANFLAHLNHKGYPYGASDHHVSEAIYLADPEGNEIEVYCDRPSSEWTWQTEEVTMTIDPLNATELLTHQDHEGWQKLPKKTIIGHLHLYVSELIQTADFYTKGLGFDIVSRYGNQALFLSTGNYHHHIALNTWMGIGAPSQPSNHTGMANYTITYPSVAALKYVLQQLNQMAIKVTPIRTNQFLTADPAGNSIYLTVN